MMNKDKTKKEEGDKILNNYKKQIAEKLAREKAERGETLNSSSSTKKFDKKGSNARLEEEEFGNKGG